MKYAALVAALVLAAGASQIGRPGYSVDEEFTEFAVRGIHAHGLPRLPSGLLYDRGLAYSYAAALADGRRVSLACSALVVLLTFVLVRRHISQSAGLLAAVLVTTSVPFWATATTARFYAPFLATGLAALLVIDRPRWLIAVACLARLVHELGFLIAVVPLSGALAARGRRREWLLSATAAATGLALGQLLLFALQAIEPSSGETMVRRFFLWQVINLFERPGDRQFGIPLVVALVAMLLSPDRSRWWIVSGWSIAAMMVAFSIARASNSAPLSADGVAQVLRDGSRYPLDMFWHVGRTTPLTVILALAAIALRFWGGARPWRPAERAAHLLWIGWLVWFGVIESGITTNYLLLPVTFMLIAIAIDVDALLGRGRSLDRPAGAATGGTEVPPLRRAVPPLRRAVPPLRRVAMVAAVAAIALDQWRGQGSIVDRLEAARPTIHIEGIDEIRSSLQPNDRVVCTDELGCLMLVGRIDRWLALDAYVRERFLVRSSADRATGVYTGVPAVHRPGDLFGPNHDGTLPDRTIVIDIFKEYPIGNSRSWLPKAIEEDGVRVTPLLETPQARVLQISPPERFAAYSGAGQEFRPRLHRAEARSFHSRP